MTEKPREGDKVRVTFEGVLADPDFHEDFQQNVYHLADGRKFSRQPDSIEILERAKPTLAQFPLDWREQVTNNYPTGFAGGLPAILELLDTWVDDAAEALKANPNGRPSAPKVVNVGDPEPPKDARYQDVDGDVWFYGRHHGGGFGWGFDVSTYDWDTEQGGMSLPWTLVGD